MSDQVHDERNAPFFWADNRLVDDHLPAIGLHAFAVYMLLAFHANSARICWPAIGTIARNLGITKPTVRKALATLADAGLVEIETREPKKTGKKEHQSHIYKLCPRTETGSKPDLPPQPIVTAPTAQVVNAVDHLVNHVYPNKNQEQEKTGIDTDVSIPRTVANAPDAPAVSTPEEDAIDALRAELSATLTEEEKAPPSVPLVSPAPAPFAHVAPGGHVWIASADSVQGMTVHLGRNTSDKSRPVCGARMKHRTEHIQLGAQPCAACVAKATAPQKPKKRQPPPDVKTYIAELCYGKGDGLIDASWSSIVNAWNETKFPGLDKLEKFKLWWYAQDFRGKKGDKPKPYQITAEWDTAMAFGLPTGPTEEEMEAEWAAAGKPRAVKRHE